MDYPKGIGERQETTETRSRVHVSIHNEKEGIKFDILGLADGTVIEPLYSYPFVQTSSFYPQYYPHQISLIYPAQVFIPQAP